jgi:dihydroxy-acid dehydratase
MALGGSTNAVIHLIALARRARVPLTLADFDAAGRQTPVLADIYPAGKHLMEDFYYAGGLLALLQQLKDRLHLGCATVNGRKLGDNIADPTVWNDAVIRPLSNPVGNGEAIAVLEGNLAPDGAVMKVSVASSNFLQHTGPALVFDSPAELAAAMNDPDLPVTPNSVLVLRGAVLVAIIGVAAPAGCESYPPAEEVAACATARFGTEHGSFSATQRPGSLFSATEYSIVYQKTAVRIEPSWSIIDEMAL